ncbi:type II secretion system protein [bacterium]|nr:type II secretion system protein [bacterium]
MEYKNLLSLSKLLSGWRRTKERRKAEGGFSLIELMVSVGIMSITLLLVLAVFVGSTRASQKSVDLTAGIVVAESVLTKEVYNIVNDSKYPANIRNKLLKGDGKPVASGVKNLNNTTFIWELTSTKVVNDTSTATDNPFGVKNSLLKLDAEVWWYKTGAGPNVDENGIAEGGSGVSGDNKRQGYGTLHCEMSRLYNESASF